MTARIEIPPAAHFAASDVVAQADVAWGWTVIREVLDAAAPLIIAAELRRLAAELIADRAPTHGRDHGTPAGLARIVRKARERADLLDPEGRAR